MGLEGRTTVHGEDVVGGHGLTAAPVDGRVKPASRDPHQAGTSGRVGEEDIALVGERCGVDGGVGGDAIRDLDRLVGEVVDRRDDAGEGKVVGAREELLVGELNRSGLEVIGLPSNDAIWAD